MSPLSRISFDSRSGVRALRPDPGSRGGSGSRQSVQAEAVTDITCESRVSSNALATHRQHQVSPPFACVTTPPPPGLVSISLSGRVFSQSGRFYAGAYSGCRSCACPAQPVSHLLYIITCHQTPIRGHTVTHPDQFQKPSS